MAHADRPTIISTADRAKAAGTRAQQGRARAFAHHHGDAVERITFADASQVDFDAGKRETDRACFAIENQLIAADHRDRFFDLVMLRDSPLPLQKAPATAQVSRSDVECAAGFAIKLLAQE